MSPGEEEGEDVALRWVGCHQGGFEVGGVSPGEGEDVALRWVGCHQGKGGGGGGELD